MKRTVAIVQCRLGSTRLPGKALREISGRPLIGHLVDRLRQVRGLDEIGLAIGDAPGNDPLVEFAKSEHLPWIIGPEDDVLWRFIVAADTFKADVILRATPDCPLWSADLGGQVLAALHSAGADYAHNTRPGVDGFDAEAFTREALERHPLTIDMEHVTPWMRQHLKTVHVQQAPELWHLKLSVDTKEDFTRVSAIMACLPSPRDYGWRATVKAARAAGLA